MRAWERTRVFLSLARQSNPCLGPTFVPAKLVTSRKGFISFYFLSLVNSVLALIVA